MTQEEINALLEDDSKSFEEKKAALSLEFEKEISGLSLIL